MSDKAHFGLVIPSVSVRWFPAGEHCTDPRSGDIILVDHGTIDSSIVQDLEKAATLRDPALRPFTWCAHAGIIRTDLDGPAKVSQMGWSGYGRAPLWDYKARLYAVASLDVTGAQRQAACAFDDAMAGVDYGWLEYPVIALDDTLGLNIDASHADHLICSAHATLVAMAMGLFPDRPATEVEPMRLAMWFGAAR